MDECDRARESSEDSLRAGITVARRPLYVGPGLIYCEDCGAEIPAARRASVPGCTRCLDCQAHFERNGGL